jgi:hypothetical protein
LKRLLRFFVFAGPASYTAAAKLAKSDARRISKHIYSETNISGFSYKPSVTFSLIHACSNTSVAGLVYIFPTTVNASIFIFCYVSN